MNIGARIIKTGLSVTLALLVANFFKMQPAVLSAVAAVIAIQPSIMRSWKYVKEVTLTNILGAIFATIGFYLFGTQPIYIGLIVILTIAVNLKLKLNKTVNLSVLTVIAILTANLHGHSVLNVLATVANRFSMVGIGVLSSFLINILVLPPKHDLRFYDSMRNLSDKMSILLRVVPDNDLSISTFKQEKKALEKLLSKTKEMFELLNGEKKRIRVSNRYLFVKKIVVFRQMLKVIQKEIVLFDKFNKHFSRMNHLSHKQTEEVKATINELLQYQESIFLIYEDKMSQQFKDNNRTEIKRKRIEVRLKNTVNELMKHYNPVNEELWWRLFPIVNSLIETENELEKLEILVNNFTLRKQSTKKKRWSSLFKKRAKS